MNQENKELLLKDLCARIPYGVKIYLKDFPNATLIGVVNEGIMLHCDKHYYTYDAPWDIEYVKPYLFPLSSMTDEQKEEYYSLADDITIKPGHDCRLGIKIHCIKLGISDNPHEEVWDYIDLRALDWLNKNHFDYRGLIEKGLAIDATGLNIY